jgi:putative transposase
LPERRKKRVGRIQPTRQQKQEAVFALCTRTGNANDVAEKCGVTREALYNWKKELLCRGEHVIMLHQKDSLPSDDKDVLLPKIETLQHQIRRLKPEKNILEGTVEIIKKDPGVDPKNLTNKEKPVLVDALRSEY